MEEININFEGYNLLVEYSWQPFEPMTQDYPGCEAGVDEITKIILLDVEPQVDLFDLVDVIAGEDGWEALNVEVHEAHVKREKDQFEAYEVAREEAREWKLTS